MCSCFYLLHAWLEKPPKQQLTSVKALCFLVFQETCCFLTLYTFYTYWKPYLCPTASNDRLYSWQPRFPTSSDNDFWKRTPHHNRQSVLVRCELAKLIRIFYLMDVNLIMILQMLCFPKQAFLFQSFCNASESCVSVENFYTDYSNFTTLQRTGL